MATIAAAVDSEVGHFNGRALPSCEDAISAGAGSGHTSTSDLHFAPGSRENRCVEAVKAAGITG